ASPQSVATLTFAANGSVVSTTGAANLTVNSGIQALYANATPSIDANTTIVLGNCIQIDVLNFGALTINGKITGPYAIVKTGIGELQLMSGSSDYSGGTILGVSNSAATFTLNAATLSGTTVTFTTSANHNYLVGNNVTITG